MTDQIIQGIQPVSSNANKSGTGNIKYMPARTDSKIVVISVDGQDIIRLTGDHGFNLANLNCDYTGTQTRHVLGFDINDYNVYVTKIALSDMISDVVNLVNSAVNGVTAEAIPHSLGTSYTPLQNSTATLTATTTQEAQEHLAAIAWKAPNNEYGTPVPVQEGVITAYSYNDTSSITLNVTLESLPIIETIADYEITSQEIISSTAWHVRRFNSTDNPLDLAITVVFDNGVPFNLTLKDKSVEIKTPQAQHPVEIRIATVGGESGGESQVDTIYISYTDTVEGRISYAKLEAVSTPLSEAMSYPVINNDQPVLKAKRDEAIERIRRGQYTGETMDAIRVVTKGDKEAEQALIQLEAGTDYAELIKSGFSNSEATTLLAIWYSVPSGAQATQTALLSKLAVVRDMNQQQLTDFLVWANTNGVTLPVGAMQGILGTPNYSETDASAISGYIDSL